MVTSALKLTFEFKLGVTEERVLVKGMLAALAPSKILQVDTSDKAKSQSYTCLLGGRFSEPTRLTGLIR